MNPIRKQLIKHYQETRYQIASIKSLFHKGRGGGFIVSAREKLMDYSPKPVGYYESVMNKDGEDTIDLSIIIPVYNAEKYIAECLESIVHQKTKYAFEVLCVDDGSPDCSADIVQRYVEEYPFVKIIRQNNRGHAGAKNRGMDEASGRYIMFVDSDDFILDSMVEVMVSEADRGLYDIVCCGFETFNENGKIRRYCDKPSSNLKEHQCFCCGKVFKRSFWNNVRLPEGYLFEDMIVLHLLSRLCGSYSYISQPFYQYRINLAGISQTAAANPKSVDQYWMVEYIEEEFNRLGLPVDDQLYSGLLNELGPYLYSRTRKLPEEIRKTVFSAAADRANGWHLERRKLSKSQKRLLDAFSKRDFYMWEMVSQYWS